MIRQISKLFTQIFGIVFRPNGTINKDIDVRYISQGNVTESLNTRTVTQDGGTTGSREVIEGNTFAFKPQDIQLQNKTFRLYIDSSTLSGGLGYAYEFSTPLAVICTAAGLITVGNINATLQDIAYLNAASISNRLNGSGQTFTINTVVTGTNKGYIDVSIDTIPCWEYEVINKPSGFFAAKSEVVIVKEAIDASLVHEWNMIGSYYLLGETIYWWTTQKELPNDISVVGIGDNGSGLVRIETDPFYEFTQADYSRVVLKGLQSSSQSLNGQWIIKWVDSTHFDLLGSVYVNYNTIVPTSDSYVTINPSGIGEIGRATKNEETGNWTYTRLIRSKAFNLVTKHQVDTFCEQFAFRKAYRFTDFYNVIRVIYDRTANYQDDCLLTFVDPINTYSYENVGHESVMILGNSDIDFGFTTQDQSGGSLNAGNKRYSVRLLTETLTPTDWTPLSNIVEVFNADTGGAATLIGGNPSTTTTGKINNFLVSGQILDIFKWIELAVVNYDGNAVSGQVVTRILITSNTMTLRHTGNEPDTTDLDVGTLNQITQVYSKAKSIDKLDGRVIISNLETYDTLDLSAWAESFKHNVKQKSITGTQSYYTGGLTVNEYAKPENLYHFSGYALNETHRFALTAILKNGAKTSAMWVDDIRIDNLPTNTAYGAIPTRRVSGLPNMNLTNSNATEVYVPYVEFVNIDWNFLINGIPIRDLVEKIEIVRVELTKELREVLGTGINVMSTQIGDGGDIDCEVIKGSSIYQRQLFFAYNMPQASDFMDYIWAGGARFENPIGTDTLRNPPYTDYEGALNQRKFCSLYIPDFLLNENSYVHSTGDKLISFGSPTTCNSVDGNATFIGGIGSAAAEFWNNFRFFSGNINSSGTQYSIVDKKDISAGGFGTFNSGAIYAKMITFETTDGFPVQENGNLNYQSSPVIQTATDIANNSSNTDFGVYQVQIYRQKSDKFGNKTLSKYISTGATCEVDVTTVSVFGGDVLTQQFNMKHLTWNAYTQLAGTSWTYPGLSSGLFFYSQNHVNSQMIDRDGGHSSNMWRYPQIDEHEWLNDWFGNGTTLEYNHGYDTVYGSFTQAAFNSDPQDKTTKYPVRIAYSQKDFPESVTDNSRIFLPLDFTDLQFKDGEIVNSKVLNGELYSWQEKKFDRHYFHSNTALTTTGGGEVIMGSGGAFTNRPDELSNYGCPNKWLIGIGRSSGGKGVAYWLNPITKTFVRHGGDGTTNQGIIHGLDSFFRNYLSLVIGNDTPADEQGGCFTWNEQFKEAIFTVRAYNNSIGDWNGGGYSKGQAVKWGSTNFEGLPDFYESKVNNNNSLPTDSTKWQKVYLTDPKYYNLFTIAFNEIKNGFEYFASFHPKIYAQYGNTYLSPRPVSNTGQVYEHDRGDYATFYDNGFTAQAEGWSFEGVINMNPDEIKSFDAIRLRSKESIERIDFETETEKSFLDETDFTFREDNWNSPIKNDSTITVDNPTGRNDLDTSHLYGDYLKVKVSGKSGIKQKIFNFIVRTRMRPRKKDS